MYILVSVHTIVPANLQKLAIGTYAIFINHHYEPPGQNVSIVSQICLILVSNCLKRSQFSLKYVSDKMSQFGLNLRPF